MEVWDTRTGRERFTLTGHLQGVKALEFSPDGKLIVSGDGSDSLFLWEAATGRLRRTLRHDGWSKYLAFSPDSKTLATSGLENGVRLWDPSTGVVRATLETYRPGYLGFSPDGRTLFAGRSPEHTYPPQVNEVRVWALPPDAPARLRADLRGFLGEIKRLVLRADDGTLLVQDEVSVQARDIHSSESRFRIAVSGAAFALSPDGSQLLAGGTLYNVSGGSPLARVAGQLAFMPNAPRLAGWSNDGLAFFEVDPAAGGLGKSPAFLKRIGPLPSTYRQQNIQYEAVISQNGLVLAAPGHLWDLSEARFHELADPEWGQVSVSALSPDGKSLYGGTRRGPSALLALPRLERKAVLSDAGRRVLSSTFSPDSRQLALLWSDGAVELRDTSTGAAGTGLPALDANPRKYELGTLTFSPGGELLAIQLPDRLLRLWNLRDRVVPIPLGSDASELIFSPNGRLLVTSAIMSGKPGAEVQSRVWKLPDGEPVSTLAGRIGPLSLMLFFPDGERVLSPNGTYSHIANLRTGAALTLISDREEWKRHGRGAAMYTGALTPDGKTLATICEEGNHYLLHLHDPGSGELRRSMGEVGRPPSRLQFLSNGKLLALQTYKNQILSIWELATGAVAKRVPLGALAELPAVLRVPVDRAGSSVFLRNPLDGRVRATLHLFPRDRTRFAMPSLPASEPLEWAITTPEGYFTASEGARPWLRWNVDDTLYPLERYEKQYRRPDLVQRALRGESLAGAR